MADEAPEAPEAPAHGSDDDGLTRRIDTSKAHPARVYDVFLGGKDNYPVDRDAAAKSLAVNPRGYLDIRHNRAFLRRAVAHLAREEGVRQFLDVGTGLPTRENVHQVAQRVAPETRVVYVDNDPSVLVHARALLVSTPQGATNYIDADLRDPARILSEAADTLDFDRPVGLVLAAILHFIEDDEAYGIVRELIRALPPGSHLVLSHLTADLNPERIGKVARIMRERGVSFVLRPRDAVLRFLTENGMEPLEPGLVPVHRWRPDPTADADRIGGPDGDEDTRPPEGTDVLDRTRYLDIGDATDEDISIYAVVARKS
ncbi:SAM-dependent methyltransferase [Streptomyces sp. NPDC048172]|uniref:SAM-dependent methyltransferase n=1 Tax=Streptomyces sp. NPDC048172 TaxID=3365505 RepID=UPI00371AE78F